MNITLSRSSLRAAVQGFSKVLNGRTTLPVLGCVRFDADTSQAKAQVTDLDQALEYRFEDADVSGAGGCLVPLATLKELAKGNKADRVEIQAESPPHITLVNHIGGHAVRQSMAGIDLDEWPVINTNIPTKPAEGFIETYRRLAPFSSTDETRYVLNSVYLEVGKGDNPVTMVATDGRRLASWNNMSLPLKESILVPVTKFLCWSRLPDNIEIGVRQENAAAWLGVKTGRFSYAAKAIEGTYPNYRQVIPAEPGEHVITLADGDVELLKQVLPTFPGKEEITFVGNDGKVTLYGRGPDDDRWTTLTLENATYRGKRAFIGLDRRYLLDALDASFREMAIADELSPVMSRSLDGGTFLQMPMRVEDPEGAGEAAPPADSRTPSAETAPSEAENGNDPTAATVPPVEPARQKEKKKVTKQNNNEQNTTSPALDRVLEACDTAKTKVREAGQALTALTSALKDVGREQKAQAKEVDSVRGTLEKLQRISL